MRVKNKNGQYLIINRFTVLLFLTFIFGCTHQQSSELASKATSTSTANTIIEESSSKQKPQSKTTETKSTISSPKKTSPSQNTIVSFSSEKTNISHLKYGWNKDFQVDNVAYDLYIPNNYNRHKITHSLLVLPGWDYPRTSWIENTNLVEYSDRYGYILILPEMGKTLYASTYYPETTMKWNAVPGGVFITTRLIPTIQQRHYLLKPGQYNTLLGLSTGGRGVALIALENPDLFAASLPLIS